MYPKNSRLTAIYKGLFCSTIMSMFLSGCIIQIPVKSEPAAKASVPLTPELMEAYEQIPKAKLKGERLIADDGIPLAQQLDQIEAFLNNSNTIKAQDGEESEVAQQIETQIKLKKLQEQLNSSDDLLDEDL